jgi:hypothetical protein
MALCARAHFKQAPTQDEGKGSFNIRRIAGRTAETAFSSATVSGNNEQYKLKAN